MKNERRFLFILLGFLFFCKQASSPNLFTESDPKERFRNYWEAGKAEIDSYELSQVRYGENHTGKAILVFVTEDFSKSKQVKLDQPEKNEEDRVKILKLNFVKNFVTGIYAYSMTLSVFTPLDGESYPRSFKETMSSQEWCGNVFTQINFEKDRYRVESYSYFEREGDRKFFIKEEWLEDELWTRMRINPDQIPLGDLTLIPGLFHSRLNHKELKPLRAAISKQKQDDSTVFTIRYSGEERTLKIRIESGFPHKILAWEETFRDFNGHLMTTFATLESSILSDYWNRNRNESRNLRKELKLQDASLF
ncbi:septum formation inhibitor Maf [Leptospira sp. 201903071]|uniref:septum formation inhibitor Maf n=1 Tax=Leptospira ainazelensis TaxID=2810034 RepID=UPI001964D1F1|nr:septum formation inhibitor Maf [Leptospira ainazelensis]MBM9502427.1 septum formation inhibitor Maf [Leptospira ainazelensis]